MSRRRNKSSLVNMYALLPFYSVWLRLPSRARACWMVYRCLSASEMPSMSWGYTIVRSSSSGLTERHYLKVHAVVILFLNESISLTRLSS